MTAGLVSYAKDDLGSKRREQMSVDCWRDQDLDDSRRPRLHRANGLVRPPVRGGQCAPDGLGPGSEWQARQGKAAAGR